MNYNNNPTLRESIQTPTETHNSEISESISQHDDNEYRDDTGVDQQAQEKADVNRDREESKIDPNLDSP